MIFLQWIQILSLITHVEVGMGYTFSAVGDPTNANPWAACLHRNMDDSRDRIIAHRTLPCGSKVIVYNLDNGRSIRTTIGERGPYGRRKVKGRPYRGAIDMSPLVNRDLRAGGEAHILLIGLK